MDAWLKPRALVLSKSLRSRSGLRVGPTSSLWQIELARLTMCVSSGADLSLVRAVVVCDGVFDVEGKAPFIGNHLPDIAWVKPSVRSSTSKKSAPSL